LFASLAGTSVLNTKVVLKKIFKKDLPALPEEKFKTKDFTNLSFRNIFL